MSTTSSQSISPITTITKAVARGAFRLPATTRPDRGPVTIAISLAISMLIVTAMLVLKIQSLNARVRRWGLAGEIHEGLFEMNATMHGDEKKTTLKCVVEPALSEEAQVDKIVPMDDTTLITERTSGQAVGYGNQWPRKA